MNLEIQTFKYWKRLAPYWTTMIIVCIIFLSLPSYCQGDKFSTEDFIRTGDTHSTGSKCFQLTDATYWQGGGIWFKNKIDLNQPFIAELELFFGCNDDYGADGMVFIFHPYLTTGFAGEGMGFGGLFPAFGIEMDTYQNTHLDDPYYDHVAFVRDGTLRHFRGLTNPVMLKDGVENIEDCRSHKVKIEWQPERQKVLFYFDGSLRVNQTVRLLEDIFKADSEVYWGFTSATGDKYNRHKVCLKTLTYSMTFSLKEKDQVNLLEGDNYILQTLNFPSGATILPTRALSELDELIRFFQTSPFPFYNFGKLHR